MPNTWMVRAETGGQLFEFFKEKSVVAIGWADIGSLDDLAGREEIAAALTREWPDWKPRTLSMNTGQLFRFRNEIKTGDRVVTYDPSRRQYLIGTVSGDYRFDEGVDEQYANIRPVTWDGEVSRDLLSVASKNSLGAISTLFLIPGHAAADLERALKTGAPAEEDSAAGEDEETGPAAEDELFNENRGRSIEFIKDRVTRLDWEQMQELVAGLLRAMGYKTRVSPSGPDRGKDIVASPDGLGFESPRIVVEVKHRKNTMGAPEIRSFLGGRHADDKGLYVSTGGFTKEAYYEAERANIPVTLMNINDLVEALTEHYEKLDVETKQLLPLKRVYWPVV